MIDLICEQCGKMYRVSPSRKSSRFCSTQCHDAARRFPLKYCKVCGKQIPYKNREYCSRSCMSTGEKGRARPDLVGKIPWSAGLSAKTDERIASIAEKRKKNVVNRNTLEQLYVKDNMSLKNIGDLFGVGKKVIGRLVDEFNLQRIPRKVDDLTPEKVAALYTSGFRYTEIAEQYQCSASHVAAIGRKSGLIGRTIQNKAGVVPTKEILEQLYWGEWLNYEKIGERLGVDFTTIPYWLKKFDIPRRTLWETRRGPGWVDPDPEIIAHLYEAENMSTESVGKLFKVSDTYIKSVLHKKQIPLRKSGYPNVSHYTAQDGHRVKSSLELQVDDWLSSRWIPHTYEPFIGGTRLKADFLVGNVYVEIWGITGNQTYEEKRKRKLEAYQHHQLELLSVYPHDFPKLQVLEPLTKYVL